MKKRIISLLIVGSLFIVHTVHAQKFTETSIFTSYYLKITEKETTFKNTKRLIKVEDENKNVYYSINPRQVFYFGKDYTLEPVDVDLETMQQISKIIYFGYGYNNQNTNQYYVATQYLIEAAFKGYTTFLADSHGNPINVFASEVQQIKNNMQNTTFSFENQTIQEPKIEITDAYILKNFKITGAHTKITNSETKITIELLDQLEEYTLQFTPKINCNDLKMWQSEDLKYIHMEEVCENTYTRTIQLEKKVVEQPPKKEDPKEKEEANEKVEVEKQPVQEEKKEVPIQKEETKSETTEKNAETATVHVPSTKRNSVSLLVLFGLLGNFYYVFKK